MLHQPELDSRTERCLIDMGGAAAALTLQDMALCAASAASATSLDLVEALRGDMPIPDNLRFRETAENMADALRSVLAILISAAPVAGDVAMQRHEDAGRLLAAVQEYLEGWAE